MCIFQNFQMSSGLNIQDRNMGPDMILAKHFLKHVQHMRIIDRLIEACARKHVREVHKILSRRFNPNVCFNLNVANNQGWTPIQAAAYNHKHGGLIVSYLIRNGADPNVFTTKPPALILATTNRNARVVKSLIKHGANVNIQDQNGCTALQHAASLAKQHQAINYIFHLRSADPNIRNHQGETALHRVAALTPDVGTHLVIKNLLYMQADLDVTDNAGETAFFYALEQVNARFLPMTTLKLLRPTDLNKRNHQGYTPLMVAVLHTQLVLVEYLLSSDVDTTAQCHDGSTALMLFLKYATCAQLNQDIVQRLAHGCVNTQDEHGDTALLIATRMARRRTVAPILTLLGCQADPTMLNHQGHHSLDEAVLNCMTTSNLEAVRILMGHGLNVGLPRNVFYQRVVEHIFTTEQRPIREDCGICLDRMDYGVQLGCGHMMHIACLEALYLTSQLSITCPYCRKPL